MLLVRVVGQPGIRSLFMALITAEISFVLPMSVLPI